MKIRKWIVFVVLLIVLGVLAFFNTKTKPKTAALPKIIQEVTVGYGDIETSIAPIGSVQPQNRLKINPPTGGRIEEILVKEGDKVKKGSVLAWMSSTDRVALIDAAMAEGEESVKYWQEVYKPSPLIAPIDGEVIVRTVEPGQNVTTATDILVLSDYLIVKALVDETDIGKVRVGQATVISLDAYPEVKIKGKVSHISYESTVINNVNIYTVNILPDEVPEVFRSGMSATVKIITGKKTNVLLMPREALQQDKEGNFVFLNETVNNDYACRRVELGISDGKDIEVISGLKPQDKVIIIEKRVAPPKK